MAITFSRSMEALAADSNRRSLAVLVVALLVLGAWAAWLFVASSGNVTDEVIAQYIEMQDVEPQDDQFKISE